MEEELASKTDEAIEKVEKVAKEAGLSPDRLAQLRREFLGVRPKSKGVAQ
jgi:hypothetical protein